MQSMLDLLRRQRPRLARVQFTVGVVVLDSTLVEK